MKESKNKLQDKQKIVWYKDLRFLAGITLIILSIIIGEFGKGLSIIKFYEPVYLITGLSLWAFSWLVLLLGIFLVGIETFRMIKYRITHQVKKTYHYTKKLPKKGYDYSRELHRKSVNKISETSKNILSKIKN